MKHDFNDAHTALKTVYTLTRQSMIRNPIFVPYVRNEVDLVLLACEDEGILRLDKINVG